MTTAPAPRLRSLDVLRGLACVLMAIDHVRVYSGVPAGGPTAPVFFTRWVTHFVAPAFCFLAGAAIYFHGKNLGERPALTRYLVSRGAVLILLELTLIRVLWTFNLDFAHYLLAGVIWMLGVCMILMGGLVCFPAKTLWHVGLAVIFLQQVTGLAGSALPESARNGALGWFLQFLYFGGRIQFGTDGPTLAILYVIVPWIGVMAAGYGFGLYLERDAEERRRCCYRIGLGATAIFLVIGGLLATFGPHDAEAGPWLFRLLGQQKYPASQLFLLMTLGPMIAAIPLAERATGWLSSVFETFGKVPMFYYLAHLAVIHSAAILVSLVRTGSVTPWLFGNHPMMPPEQPEGYRWSLWLLYLVWIAVLPVLYLGCRWYAALKRRHPTSLLRFI